MFSAIVAAVRDSRPSQEATVRSVTSVWCRPRTALCPACGVGTLGTMGSNCRTVCPITQISVIVRCLLVLRLWPFYIHVQRALPVRSAERETSEWGTTLRLNSYSPPPHPLYAHTQHSAHTRLFLCDGPSGRRRASCPPLPPPPPGRPSAAAAVC